MMRLASTIVLLVLFSGSAAAQTFMRQSMGRRNLLAAPASAPATPLSPMCDEPEYISTMTTPMDIFDQLTVPEYMNVAEYMVNTFDVIFPAQLNQTGEEANSNGMVNVVYNDTAPEGGMPMMTDNFVVNIFLAPPNKTEALAYLDGSAPKPKRYANVVVIRGAEDVPDVMEYKVGPLPASLDGNTTAEMLYKPGEIPWHKRPSSDIAERTAMKPLLAEVNAELTPLFLAMTGQCIDTNDTRCDGNNISQWSQPSYIREVDGSSRVKIFWNWLIPKNGGAADELFPLPLYFKLNVTSMDPEEWYAFDVEHCAQGFPTVTALMDAFEDGSLKVCDQLDWASPSYNAVWSDDVQQGPGRKGSNKAGPRLYEPQGKRFSLLHGASPTSRVFEWQGWEGHVTADPYTGLQFHNIKFKGERILYELALQDQFVAYSGFQSIGQSYYYDATYMLGAEQYTLRPGVDCPETASYFDVTTMGEYGQILHFKGGVCIFEDSTSTTTWRHFDYEEEDVSSARDRGIKSYELVVRTIATVGNYDYMYDVRFQLDGEIRVLVNMAGYMQNTYYDNQHGLTEQDKRFGTRTHPKTTSNIHDHLTSWKVDFDIQGVSNSFHKTSLRAGNTKDIFGTDPPSYSSDDAVVKYATDTLVENEAGFKLSFSEPSIFTISNDAALNEWGAARSYGIFHQYTAPQLLPDTHPLVKGAAWTKYNVAVTQRKEMEVSTTKDMYDAHGTTVPVNSLDKFLNNETIVNKDLVAWVSMGIIHVPRAEDVPLISNIGSEFQLKPINFLSHLGSLDVVDQFEFEACMPRYGAGQFDYSWNDSGNNYQFNKAAFTLSNSVSTVSASSIGGKK